MLAERVVYLARDVGGKTAADCCLERLALDRQFLEEHRSSAE
jgi:hypothetical protein